MKNFKRFLKVLVIVVGVVFILDAVFILFMANWQPKVGKSDAVIILGAAINTPALTNRTLTALDIYKEGNADLMILSGGKIADSDLSEAAFMEKVIKRNTADPVNYVLEDKSHTTYENIKNSKTKLGENQKTITIVSDKFHIARAFLLAKRAGFKTVYWSSPVPDYYSREDLNYYYLREFIAILDYIPKFIFG